MKSYALFQQYIWLVNTIHKYRKLTLDEINQHWLDTDMSEGLPIARSTFNRHRDAILDMFGVIIECDKKDGFRYYIYNVVSGNYIANVKLDNIAFDIPISYHIRFVNQNDKNLEYTFFLVLKVDMQILLASNYYHIKVSPLPFRQSVVLHL